MSEQHIIITNKVDKLYPMAWGVKGGDIKADGLFVADSNLIYSANTYFSVNKTTSNIAQKAEHIQVESNAGGITLTTTNGGQISANSDGDIILNTANSVDIDAVSNVIITSSNSIGVYAINTYVYGNMELYSSNVNMITPTVKAQVLNVNTQYDLNATSQNNMTLSAPTLSLSTSNTLTIGGTNAVISAGNVSVGGSSVSVSTGNLQLQGGTELNMQAQNVQLRGSNFDAILTNNVNLQSVHTNVNSTNIGINADYANITANTSHNSLLNNKYNSTTVANTAAFHTNVRTIAYNNSAMNGAIIGTNVHLVGDSKVTGVLNTDELIFSKVQTISNSPTYTFSNSVSSYNFIFGIGNITTIVDIPITTNININTLDNSSILEAYVESDTDCQLNGILFLELYNSTDSESVGYYVINSDNVINTSNGITEKYRRIINTSYTAGNILSFMETNKSYSFRLCYESEQGISGTYNLTGYVNIYSPQAVTGGGGGGSIIDANLFVPYSTSATYSVGDIVYYNGYLYRCITAVLVPEAFDNTKWVQTSVTGELSNINKYINSLENLNNVQF